MWTHRLLSLFVALASLYSVAACKNPRYCAGNPDNDCRQDPDGPRSCSGDGDCSAPAGVCDLGATMTCVQCTTDEHDACTGATPACVDNQCQKCTEHAQCAASNVCLPDGSCADPTQVAYVDPKGTDNTECSKLTPCMKVTAALATNRPYVKFHDTTDEAVSISGGRVVTFLADPNAKLTRSTGTGAIVTVQGNGTALSVYDLSISNAPNDLLSGIGCVIPTASGAPTLSLTRVKLANNPGGGISVTGGTLTVSQSTVSGNMGGGISASGGTLMVSQSTVNGNAGGGIVITGLGTIFDVENNVVAYNGVALGPGATQNGGVVVASNTSGSKIERNTIAFNQSSGLTFRGGMSCNAPLVAAAVNLIFHNTEGDGTGGIRTDPTTQKNDVGNCQYGNTLAVPTDAGNLGFKSPILEPYDFHLTRSSPPTVVDAGGICSGIDIDGEARPIGAACDLGADEYHP